MVPLDRPSALSPCGEPCRRGPSRRRACPRTRSRVGAIEAQGLGLRRPRPAPAVGHVECHHTAAAVAPPPLGAEPPAAARPARVRRARTIEERSAVPTGTARRRRRRRVRGHPSHRHPSGPTWAKRPTPAQHPRGAADDGGRRPGSGGRAGAARAGRGRRPTPRRGASTVVSCSEASASMRTGSCTEVGAASRRGALHLAVGGEVALRQVGGDGHGHGVGQRLTELLLERRLVLAEGVRPEHGVEVLVAEGGEARRRGRGCRRTATAGLGEGVVPLQGQRPQQTAAPSDLAQHDLGPWSALAKGSCGPRSRCGRRRCRSARSRSSRPERDRRWAARRRSSAR